MTTFPTTTPQMSEPRPRPVEPDEGAQDQVNQRLDQAQRRLDAMRQALGHSHRLTTLGTLAAVVAHEYHNLLTPVISYAQFALSEGQEDDPTLMRKALRRALEQAQDAAELSRTILSFARDEPEIELEDMPNVGEDPAATTRENGSVSNARRATTGANLRRVIDQSLACLGRDPAKDGIEVRIDVPDLVAAMPAVSLQQVLVNLLLNSRKAMLDGGGRIVIYGDHEEKWIHLTVADTGPGIDPKEAEYLFEPFVTRSSQGSPYDTGDWANEDGGGAPSTLAGPTQPKGTGLGLCVCRELIHAVGGQIHVDSTPGQGATFHLSLPCL